MIMTERKISLPAYKLAYAFCFVVILSLIRGINFSYEIGIAMEAPMAILAMVFCADTYTQEITSKRSEIHRLYPMKNVLFPWEYGCWYRRLFFCIECYWLRYVL